MLGTAFFMLPAWSSAQTGLKAQVVDSTNKPLPFVSASLYQDSLLLSNTITGDSGFFHFVYPSTNHLYSIHLSMVGFRDTTLHMPSPGSVLAPIILYQDASLLSFVTITSRQPIVNRKVDRFVINIENSFLSNGLSGLEVLQKSPGIWVNSDGTIRVKGNQPVRVMINDMVMQMSGEELSIYLSSLKSEDISIIEVITNPSAEFEAGGEGGIVRIILKKGRKNGLNGSANAQYRYRTGRPLYSAGTALDVKFKNIFISGGFDFRKDNRLIRENTQIEHPDQSRFNNESDRLEDFTSRQIRMGAFAEINKEQNIGIESSWSAVDIQQEFITGVNYLTPDRDITGRATTSKHRKFRDAFTTVNYSWATDTAGSVFKIIAGYSQNNRLDTQLNQEQYSDSIPDASYRYHLPFVTEIYNAQSDYIKKLPGKVTLKAGIKYVSIQRDNTVYREDLLGNLWVENTGAGNRFIYTEQLMMGYSTFEKRIKDISIQGGLRYEHTASTGNLVTSAQMFRRKYAGLFPSLFVQHFFGGEDGNSVYLNYSRRLSRPALTDLNPYRFVYNNYITLTGNPAILPEYTYNISTGVLWRRGYSADIYLTRTKNVITLVAKAGRDNSLDYYSENVNSSTGVGVNIAAPVTLFPGWTMNNNASLDWLNYEFEGNKVKQVSCSVKSVNTISMKHFLDLDLVAEYQSPHRYSNIYTLGTFYTDIGISKKVMKNKASIRLMFTDIFNGVREKEITNAGNTKITFFRKRQTRSVQLSLAFNFKSGSKFRSNQIDEGNQEEKRRSGN